MAVKEMFCRAAVEGTQLVLDAGALTALDGVIQVRVGTVDE
jgi:hypothetical protein